mmetsp:Transcript_47714/g.91169  ORF Transcript_47714/g.91169 Transcript_47714/m.91169 type:complete len:265 (+) Transcript_47714:758-1552(+)
MGPSMMSPMAYTFLTLVWNWSFTFTLPRSPISTPAASSPRLEVKGRRPMAMSATSASSSSCLSPLALSTLMTRLPSAFLSIPITLVLSLNLSPCLVSTRWNVLDTSASMPAPPMEPRNSTTVTLAPSRSHTEPSSRPMTPAPITTILPGTFLSDSAPVEDTMLSSSMVTPGKGVTSEPVASMTCFALSVFLPPSASSTSTVSAESMRPAPLTYSTLFFLKSPSMPPVSWPTEVLLAFIIFSKSMRGLSTRMPRLSKSFWAWWKR